VSRNRRVAEVDGVAFERAFRKRREYIPVGSDGDILSPTVSKGPLERDTIDRDAVCCGTPR